jgi:hypothetical protein
MQIFFAPDFREFEGPGPAPCLLKNPQNTGNPVS